MNRIKKIFLKNKEKGLGTFVGYITFGAPTSELTLKAIEVMLENGVDIIELGVPFSDMVADGNIIRKASLISLANNVTLENIFDLIGNIREKFPDNPLIIFSYYNVIFNYGLSKFFNKLEELNLDGVLPVDVPLEERDEILPFMNGKNLSYIPLIAPTTTDERIKKIISGMNDTFIYNININGTTGVRDELPDNLKDRLKLIKKISKDIPLVSGFGIQNFSQAKMISNFADGYVIGSKIMKILLEEDNPLKKLQNFVRQIKFGE